MTIDRQGAVASIAWYKLADLIARGEREKALSVYRLLSHSFDDRAYALQLEGDILWALDDPRSRDRYYRAAVLYKDDKRLVDAAALAEHLLAQHPKDAAILLFAVYCYVGLDVKDRSQRLFELFKQSIKERGIALDFFAEELTELKKLAHGRPWINELLAA